MIRAMHGAMQRHTFRIALVDHDGQPARDEDGHFETLNITIRARDRASAGYTLECMLTDLAHVFHEYLERDKQRLLDELKKRLDETLATRLKNQS